MSPLAFAEPPPLPQGAPPGLGQPVAIGAGTILAAIAARLMTTDTLPAIECHWLRWIGIPCPGCGGTRCLAACGRLDIAAAFAWNPLVALGALALVGWSVLGVARPELAARLGPGVRGLFTGRRIAAGLTLNWLYLCWALSR